MTRVRYVGSIAEDGRGRSSRPSRERRIRRSAEPKRKTTSRRSRTRIPFRRGIVSLLLLGALGCGFAATLRVDRIEVRGAVAADQDRLRELLPAAFGGRLFFADRSGLKDALLLDPWIQRVGFSARFDGTLVVRVQESVPAFSLEDGGAICEDGSLLPPRRNIDVSGLTRLRAPRRQGTTELSKGVQGVVRHLCAALNRTPWTWPSGLESVEVETDGSVRLLTGGGVEVVLGSEGWDRRLTALAAALPSLRPGPGDRLDMRFDRQVVVTPADAGARRLGG